MAKKVTLKDNVTNETLYPKTVAGAVYDESGNPIDTLIEAAGKIDEKIYADNVQPEHSFTKTIALVQNTQILVADYIGFGKCTFSIVGSISPIIQLTAINKGTGNAISLYSSGGGAATLPITFDNPRPDLELITLKLVVGSQSAIGDIAITVTRANETTRNTDDIAFLEADRGRLNASLFNIDSDDTTVYKAELSVKKNQAYSILDYLGACPSTFTVSGQISPSFQIVATNKASGTVFSLYDSISTAASLPVTFTNPRPDLEFINVKMNMSSTSQEGDIEVTITKGNAVKEIKETVNGFSESLLDVKRSSVSQNKEIVSGKAIYTGTSEVGDTIDLTDVVDNESFEYILLPVKKGDVIYLTGHGGELPRLWAFLDLSSALVSQSAADASSASFLKLTAHQDGFFLSNNAIGQQAYNILLQRGDDLKNIVVNDIHHMFTASGSVTIPYYFEPGKVYTIRNESASALMNVFTRQTSDGQNVETVASGLSFGKSVTFRPSQQAFYVWIYANAKGGVSIIDQSSISSRVQKIESVVSTTQRLVSFDLSGNDFIDTAGQFSRMNYSSGMYQPDVIEQVYTLFDELTAANQSYITKVDAVSFANDNGFALSYPEYCNGISTEGTYLVTPQYRINMYKLISTDAYLTGNGARPKKKVLLIGGIHGNEKIAPFNLYELAYNLCNRLDESYYQLRASTDFYIIPYVNGYGCYHTMRGNANKVNLNRNFPVAYWAEAGASSKDDPTGCDYTGPSAGSEFETQLVMACVDSIAPDMFIDHHNYGPETPTHFYTDYTDPDTAYVVNQACVDVCSKLVGKYPDMFGTKYLLPLKSTSIGTNPSIGTTVTWGWEQRGVKSFTIEVSHSINYRNGSPVSNGDAFTAKVENIAEFTLRHQLCIFIDYLLSHF